MNVDAEVILQDATEGALLAAKNDAFMKLFRENMRYSLQLEIVQTVLSQSDGGQGRNWINRMSHDMPQLPHCFSDPLGSVRISRHYVLEKQAYLDEKRKWDKLCHKNGGRKKKKVDEDKKSTRMWFLQHEDSMTLTIADVRELQMQLKVIWQTICDAHGHISVPWSKVPCYFQLTFYEELERNCSFFHLCDDHYKADAVAPVDYWHWYYLHYPPPIEDEDVVMSKQTYDIDRQHNTCQQVLCRHRLQMSPSASSNHDVATGSAVKTPPVTSLTDNEDVHAASEINKQDEQMAREQANIASLAEDDDM
ncbi:hypothetical protein EI94DRAFT_1697899 [Lactarius quietus]|nr:hypothetical protein EI94DRAFT_1697899 [Lactarius quietus]